MHILKLTGCILLLFVCAMTDGAAASSPPVRNSANTGSASNTEWIEVNGVSLRYQLTGAGRHTIVLLHEMGMSLESWDLIAPELSQQHRVLRYDLRGFGLSEKIHGTVTFADEVEDLRALLDALHIQERVTLVGGAVGGATALAFAATYPERVNGVVAISPATGAAPSNRAGVLAQAARAENLGMRPLLDADLEAIYPTSIRSDAARVARFRAIQLATDPYSMAATLRMIAITDFNDYYPKIVCPSLIIAAALYEARPVAAVQQVATAINNAQFAVLQTGHFVAWQSPELLMPVLHGFLNRVEQ